MIPLCKALGGEGCWPFCKGAGCEHPSCDYKLVTQVLLGNFNGDANPAIHEQYSGPWEMQRFIFKLEVS